MKSLSLRILMVIAILGLAQLACAKLTTAGSGDSGTDDEISLPTVASSRPTASSARPIKEPTEAPSGYTGCEAVQSEDMYPSGYILDVTMAKGVSGDILRPVGSTTVFAGYDSFHAVVAISDAPQDTTFKAKWYADDTFGVVECNSVIDSYELTAGGTRNIDFSLRPKTSWPAGTYRVEIFVDGALDQVSRFQVD